MTAYNKIVDYAAKDALLTGNPAKIVKGVEIGAEFDSIAAADATNIKTDGTHAATSKVTPVDADELPLVDSAASWGLKRLTWANLKATILTWLQGTVFPSPGAIGGTTPAAGSFTTLSATGNISQNGQTMSVLPASGVAELVLGSNVASGCSRIFMKGNTTQYNWKIANSDAISDSIEFTRSTAAAGSTYTTPVVVISGTGLAVTGALSATGTISPQQATTAGAPAYVKGALYFDTTLNKLRVGGATAWETVTSV